VHHRSEIIRWKAEYRNSCGRGRSKCPLG
jgi:hypothetical protein